MAIAEWFQDATNIAFVALALFVVLLVFLGVPAKIMAALDSQSQAVAKELREARRLREEAEALLADYKAKHAQAQAEAAAIVEAAEEQAARVAAETRASILAAIERRERQAEERIASAEAKAADDVRAAAIEAAMAAAERLIRERLDAQAQAGLIAEGVGELRRKFA